MNYLVTQEAVTTSSAALAAIDAEADAMLAAAAQLQSGLDAYAQFISTSFENEMSIHDAAAVADMAHYAPGLHANNYRGTSLGAAYVGTINIAHKPVIGGSTVLCWDPNHSQASTSVGNYLLCFTKSGVTYQIPASTTRGGPGVGITAVSVWLNPTS